MTLEDLIERYRSHLADESIGVRRSWEEMFRYTLKHWPRDTPVEDFDPDTLSDQLISAGLHRPIVDGYIGRWREALRQPNAL